MTQTIEHITKSAPNYPDRLIVFLKTEAPEIIWARGNIVFLTGQNTGLSGSLWALFCSSKCPCEIILKTHGLAQQLQKSGIPTIGGYHSPVEKECLRILLRGSQLIIICPARSLENMRLRPEWKRALSEGRLLILSIFDSKYRRPTAELARRRNAFVAALADKIFIAHASEDSKTLQFAQMVLEWRKPVFTFDTKANKPLLQLGVQRI